MLDMLGTRFYCIFMFFWKSSCVSKDEIIFDVTLQWTSRVHPLVEICDFDFLN